MACGARCGCRPHADAKLGTVGLMPPLLRSKLELEWTDAQQIELRAVGAASRRSGPLLPDSFRNFGPKYLHWRADAIARGEVASGKGSQVRVVEERGGGGRRARVSPTLLERALATPELAADKTSERILDAALELVAASGLRHLTMDAAASRAGVGRMTVYRRFGDRDGLIDALAAREARRCLAELDRAVDPSLPVVEGIARGLVTSLRLIRSHPILDRFSRHEPEAALAALNSDDGAILRMGTASSSPRVSRKPRAAATSRRALTRPTPRSSSSASASPSCSCPTARSRLTIRSLRPRRVQDLIAPILGGP